MRALKSTCVLILLSAVTLTFSNANAGSRLQYFESLQSVDISPTTLQFNAFSRTFDIVLEVNGRLSASALQAGGEQGLVAYQGRLANVDNSWVRIVIVDGQPRGLIWDGSEMYAVEASPTAAGTAVMFRIADLVIDPGTLSCGDIGIVSNGADLLKSVVGEISNAAQSGPGATSQIDVGVIGDFEFTSNKGSAANSAILTRMNNVDGIFSEQLGVQLNVALVETFPQNNDPFSDELGSSQLLNELADYRQGNPAQNVNGLTHLFTGRNLTGSTVGVAYGGALCSTRFGAGLTEGTHSETLDSLIAAHELGHNFGAPHDGTSGSACETTPQDFLMAPSLNGSDTFSACSIEQMQDDVMRASCISPLAVSEVSVVAGPTQPALLGSMISVGFNVNSLGMNAASGVSVDVSVPNNVTLQTATTSMGSCTNGAATVTCSIGTVAGGSSATVTVVGEASDVGNSVFTATASADADTNGNNNQATLQVNISPAVDVSVTAAMVQSLTINQSATLTLSLANLATIQATNVSLNLDFDGGVSIDSAEWGLGACTIDALNLTCSANALAAQSNTAISIGVTGLTEGSHNYTVSMTSDESDIDFANNNVSGSVSVTPVGGGTQPPSNDDDGGSGALGTMLIALLSGVCLARRRRPKFSPK